MVEPNKVIQGGVMEENSDKIRTGIYLEKELLDECDCFLEQSNSRSRNELIQKAIKFYLGYLKAQDNVEYLAPAIKKLVTSAVSASEEKTSRLLFKIAVELGKISNMLAAANEVDDETLRELHIMCIDEVRKINGIITYDSAARFQRDD